MFMNESIKQKALSLFDNGDLDELFELIKPYIAAEEPYAMYLYSCFSRSEWNESDEGFEERSLRNLYFAAERNVPEAMYKLACYYLNGEFVEKNLQQSAIYFERAAKGGHSRSKLSHGMNLYHGGDGSRESRILALKFIEEAASEGVDGADVLLSKLKTR